jgi:2-keto-4-pentenoate hydratase/2-oxohepta-3-ene-1,7-dioic acid hydratase in catechol pathway
VSGANTERFGRLELDGGRRVFVRIEKGRAAVLSDAPWHGGRPTGELIDGVDDEARGVGRRLSPVGPSKILCVGKNYRAHAQELGTEAPPEPLLFLKPTTSLLDPDGTIELPPTRISTRIEHEAELAFVIGRRVRRASLEEAADAIFGFTIAGDITARDLQKKDGQWTRAKGMDTFCPVGPVIVTGLDPLALEIRCTVSGGLRQNGVTRDMLFPPALVVSYASDVMTLEPGDLVLTGTPAGVGPLVHGDKLAIVIGGIGSLELDVAASPEQGGSRGR